MLVFVGCEATTRERQFDISLRLPEWP